MNLELVSTALSPDDCECEARGETVEDPVGVASDFQGPGGCDLESSKAFHAVEGRKCDAKTSVFYGESGNGSVGSIEN